MPILTAVALTAVVLTAVPTAVDCAEEETSGRQVKEEEGQVYLQIRHSPGGRWDRADVSLSIKREMSHVPNSVCGRLIVQVRRLFLRCGIDPNIERSFLRFRILGQESDD